MSDLLYEFKSIEAKWQADWQKKNLFAAKDADTSKPKYYGLVFFPYPSGAGISIGHCKNYIPVDVACRHKMMQGYNVLQPMGWDAFGLPAENEAIKRGRNPREMVPEYAANYRRQLDRVGIAYDWSREIDSSRPDYYRWTQWFFLMLLKRGLAYRSDTPINWCPSCKTGLANEEVVNGKCWRCGQGVEKRPLPQWYFRITSYAERLITGLDTIEWPDGIKMMQREWIGKSTGAEVDFSVDTVSGGHDRIRVFTTRPDTLWGATFMVLAPEHPLVDSITTPAQAAAVREYRERARTVADIDRQSTERKKTGVFTGTYAVNPVNGQRIPVYIADYVLMGYGTGAIMAVPAHDQRDFDFAKEFNIPIVLVYQTHAGQTAESMTAAVPDEGTMAIGPFAGSPNHGDTVAKVVAWVEKQGFGKGVVNYRLRDWLISRQRYWGAPIPVIHCEHCGIVPVPEKDLPVLLPNVERYEPSGTGESPLAGIPEFVNTTCPTCGKPARRETDTMGGFACSSWYFLRFADPRNSTAPFNREAAEYWLPVDVYSGGAEHAVMHLLYARFWTKVMHDEGLVSFDEPFRRLRNQGMLLTWTAGRAIKNETTDETDGNEPIENWKVLKPEERATTPEAEKEYRWVKMSKSLYNVVTPDEMADQYGADALRIYILFAAPFEDTVLWKDAGGVEAANRFLSRVWRIWNELVPCRLPDWRTRKATVAAQFTKEEKALYSKLHQTIVKMGEDFEHFRFNTAIAALMELTNMLSAFRNSLQADQATPAQAVLASEIVETVPLVMAPMTPHFAEELWQILGKTESIFATAWPKADPAALKVDEIEIPVQVNGKVKARILVSPELSVAELEKAALADAKVQEAIAGKTVAKCIAVPGRIVNIAVKG